MNFYNIQYTPISQKVSADNYTKLYYKNRNLNMEQRIIIDKRCIVYGKRTIKT